MAEPVSPERAGRPRFWRSLRLQSTSPEEKRPTNKLRRRVLYDESSHSAVAAAHIGEHRPSDTTKPQQLAPATTDKENVIRDSSSTPAVRQRDNNIDGMCNGQRDLLYRVNKPL